MRAGGERRCGRRASPAKGAEGGRDRGAALSPAPWAGGAAEDETRADAVSDDSSESESALQSEAALIRGGSTVLVHKNVWGFVLFFTFWYQSYPPPPRSGEDMERGGAADGKRHARPGVERREDEPQQAREKFPFFPVPNLIN